MSSNVASVSSMATCSLCSKFFTDPRMLPCLHSFCYECLSKKFSKVKKESYYCPTCHADFTLRNGDLNTLTQDLRKEFEVEVAEFECKVKGQSKFSCDRCAEMFDNMAVTYCGTCHDFLCSHCKSDHQRCKQTLNHKLLELGKKFLNNDLLKTIPHKMSNCSVHNDEVLKFYCTTCSQLVCRDCVILSHQQHKYDRMEQVGEKEKLELKSFLGEVESSISKLDSALAQSKEVINSIHKKQERVVKDIEEEFTKIQEMIEARKKVLLVRVTELSLEKETALKLQQEPMSATRKEMQMLATQLQENVEVYSPAELLSTKSLITTRWETIKKKFGSLDLVPCKNDYFSTSLKNTMLINEIEKYGYISAGAYPGNCVATFNTQNAFVGKEYQVRVIAKDSAGNGVEFGGELLTAELKKVDLGGKITQGKIHDHGNGTYTVTVTPSVAGKLSLEIKIGNESIQSSPFLLTCKNRDYMSLNVLRTYALTSVPYDVAESGDKLFVVHGSNPASITAFDKTTGASQALNIGTVKLQYCYGIAERDGHIYVTNYNPHCVYKFAANGKLITTIGSQGSGAGQLSSPYCLCVSADGTIYVTEGGNQRVSVFHSNGTYIQHISLGQSTPWGTAIDSLGNLHVVSFSNGNVTVFNPQGQQLQQYGQAQQSHLRGIAIDPDQNTMLINYSSNSSKIFALKPQFNEIATFHKVHSFGVCLDKNGFIYVCDADNNRVLKY